jgi:predicted ATPase
MRDLPSGTVTFLFTDIEGSTRLLHELGPERYAEALAEHRRLLREAFVQHGGVEVDTQGDAFFVAFADARGALAAAEASQRALEAGPIRIRIGLHSGSAHVTDEGYVGSDVHLGARVAAAAHGGQVVVSQTTRALLDDRFALVDLGEHRLKDIREPIPIFQLGDDTFPPLKTISNTNLPRPASSFVGRERELREVVALIQGGGRLVTLTGPGGSGKTRLAIEAAASLVSEYRAGVFWIGLAALRDSVLVVETVAQTLGAKDGLAEHIGEREMLLVLDNLEQVIEAARDLTPLLSGCPNLTLLVTSRELLRIDGEVEYPVPALVEAEAVDLFCARARIDPSDEIAELCRRLDALPLAVELAAARSKALSPRQILERISQRLDLFKGGRDADPRQQTLRATIEWSYHLLTAEEQQLFRRLAAFADGCTLGAAEDVCGADIDTLQSLVEKSLVRLSLERYWMLETIRDYAHELLQATGELEAMSRAHAEYFLVYAESLGLAVEAYETGGGTRYELALAEQGNLRSAIDWSLDGDPELGLRLAIALEQFWVANNPYEGARRFEQLLARATDAPLELRARGFRCHGGALTLSGALDQAHAKYAESLELYERLGDEWGTIHLRHRRATTALSSGDWDTARATLEDNLAHARAFGSSYLEGEALSVLGIISDHDGRPEEAVRLLRRSRELARAVGFTWREAIDLSNLAEISLKLDHVDEAEEYGRASLELADHMADRLTIVTSLATLALVAKAQDDAARAGRLWGAIEAEEVRAPLGRWDLFRDDFAEQLLVLDGPEFAAGRRTGRLDSLEAATDYALGRDD